MTTPVSLPAKRRNTLGRVLAVLGVLTLTVMVASFVALAAWVRSMGAPGDLGRFRSELVSCLDAAPSSTVQVVVPTWLMALVRLGAPVGDLEPEVSTWLKTMHAAEVGVYGLRGPPQHHDVLLMLNRADERLEARDLSRMVTVLEEGTLVAIYGPATGNMRSGIVDCVIVVVDESNLVVVSARARAEPLLELATARLGQVGLAGMRL